MRDLDERFSVLDLLDPPDQWEAISQATDIEPLRAAPRSHRPAWALAAAAFATMVVIGGAILITLPDDSPAPVVTQAPAPSITEPPVTAAPTLPPASTVAPAPVPPATAAPTTAPSEPEQTEQVTWTPVASEAGGLRDHDHLYEVIRSGSQWIAAGSRFQDTAVIAFWKSEDGATWTTSAELPMSELVGRVSPFEADGQVTALVEAGERFLAFAHIWDQSGNDGLVALTSSDGSNWSPLDTGAFSIRGDVNAVTKGTGGWIAVGREVGAGIDPGESPAMWRSTDGLTWERIDLRGTALDTSGVLYDIVHGESGWVTVGHSPIDNGFAQATAWTSSDGEHWTQVLLPSVAYEVLPGFGVTESGPCISDAYTVTAGPAGYVAAGDCVPIEAPEVMTTAWSSVDGLEWTQSTEIEGVFDEPASIVGAVATDSGYALAGWRLHPNRMSPTVWTSEDGLLWDMTDFGEIGVEIGILFAVAADGDQLVAAGWGKVPVFVGIVNDRRSR